MRIGLTILRTAAWLVPGDQRTEWFDEWNAELCYVRSCDEGRTIGFCLGAFRDALCLRRNGPSNARPWLRLQSPAQCLGFLGLMAVACTLFAFRFHPPVGPSLLAMLCLPLMSLPGLFASTSVRLGEYPPNRYGWRWVFFASKIALVLPIVYFGVTGMLAMSPTVAGMAGATMLILYVIAFRWAVADQRHRCPECLRLLDHPTRIGQPSHTLLDWYGTEFVCVKGHGVLHVPDAPTMLFHTQRWLHLDQSWRVWFSRSEMY
jgi:hypothetical protein